MPNDRIEHLVDKLRNDCIPELIPFIREMEGTGESFTGIMLRLQVASVIARQHESDRKPAEAMLARSAIIALLGAGFQLTVYDGEEETLKRSTDADAIYDAMFTTDEDYLYVYKPGGREMFGWVRFIYGNDGWDVISDYTTNLESELKRTNMLAEYLSGDRPTVC